MSQSFKRMYEESSLQLHAFAVAVLCKQTAERFGKERPVAIACFQETALKQRENALKCNTMH